MKLRFFGLVAASALAFLSGAAIAQDNYPNRPIQMIVGFAAGSGADIGARPFAALLEKQAGQSVVIANRPGNNGNLSMILAANAKPDGYTVYYGGGTNFAAAPIMVKDFPIDVEKDLIPIRTTSISSFLFVVSADSPVKSMADLTAHLKSGGKQKKFGYATNIGEVAGGLYIARAGAKVDPVAYKTAVEAIPDLTSGALDFFIIDTTFGRSQIAQGKIRALANTGAQRSPLFPDLPTAQEQGVGDFDFTSWFALYVPKGTPQHIIQKLDQWHKAAMETPEAAKHYTGIGAGMLFEDSKEISARIIRQKEMWTAAAKAAGIEAQ